MLFRSDRVRLAITTGIKTAGAPMRFHYVSAPGELEIFEMDQDFLLRFDDFFQDIYERPKFGNAVGKIAFTQASTSKAVILEKIMAAAPLRVLQAVGAEPVAERSGFWKRLFGR